MKFRKTPQYLLATMLFVSAHSNSIHSRHKGHRNKNHNNFNPTIFHNNTNQPILLTIFSKKNKIQSIKKIKPYEVISLMLNRIKNKITVNNQPYHLQEQQYIYKIV